MSCSAAAQCSSITDCGTCLKLSFASEECGWCTTTNRCSVGDASGPYNSSAAVCPNAPVLNAWRWNAFNGDYLQCYEQLPYLVATASLTTRDYVSFSLGAATWLALLALLAVFGGCTPCCEKWTPQPGQAHSNSGLLEDQDQHQHQHQHQNQNQDQQHLEHSQAYEHEHEHEHGDEDGANDSQAAANDSGGCCSLCCCCFDSLNSSLGRLVLWLVSALSLCSLVVGLVVDSWSVSRLSTLLVGPADNPVTTLEGLAWATVSLSSSAQPPVSYSYDCAAPGASDSAHLECQMHAVAGIHALVCGILAGVAGLASLAMASNDVCCSSASALRRYDGLNQQQAVLSKKTGSSGHAVARRVAVAYPFSLSQWRAAVLTSVFGLSCCAFWAGGSYLVSEQRLAHLQLSVSFGLMAAAGTLAAALALMYRRAIMLTPKAGYRYPPTSSDADSDRDCDSHNQRQDLRRDRAVQQDPLDQQQQQQQGGLGAGAGRTRASSATTQAIATGRRPDRDGYSSDRGTGAGAGAGAGAGGHSYQSFWSQAAPPMPIYGSHPHPGQYQHQHQHQHQHQYQQHQGRIPGPQPLLYSSHSAVNVNVTAHSVPRSSAGGPFHPSSSSSSSARLHHSSGGVTAPHTQHRHSPSLGTSPARHYSSAGHPAGSVPVSDAYTPRPGPASKQTASIIRSGV